MIVYAVADIHGRPERLNRIRETVREHRPDLIVAAGDLTRRGDPAPVVDCLAGLHRPVLLVRGNTDPPARTAAITALPGVTDLHLGVHVERGFRFAGIGGTVMLPFRSRIALRETAILEAAAPLLDTRTVLVVHPPPLGVRDRVLGRIHAGSAGIAALVRARRPLLVICGHIHEAAGAKQTGGTTVVNCTMGGGGDGAVIRLSSITGPEVFFP